MERKEKGKLRDTEKYVGKYKHIRLVVITISTSGRNARILQISFILCKVPVGYSTMTAIFYIKLEKWKLERYIF